PPPPPLLLHGSTEGLNAFLLDGDLFDFAEPAPAAAGCAGAAPEEGAKNRTDASPAPLGSPAPLPMSTVSLPSASSSPSPLPRSGGSVASSLSDGPSAQGSPLSLSPPTSPGSGGGEGYMELDELDELDLDALGEDALGGDALGGDALGELEEGGEEGEEEGGSAGLGAGPGSGSASQPALPSGTPGGPVDLSHLDLTTPPPLSAIPPGCTPALAALEAQLLLHANDPRDSREEKRAKRLVRNRLAAQAHRERKRVALEATAEALRREREESGRLRDALNTLRRAYGRSNVDPILQRRHPKVLASLPETPPPAPPPKRKRRPGDASAGPYKASKFQVLAAASLGVMCFVGAALSSGSPAGKRGARGARDEPKEVLHVLLPTRSIHPAVVAQEAAGGWWEGEFDGGDLEEGEIVDESWTELTCQVLSARTVFDVGFLLWFPRCRLERMSNESRLSRMTEFTPAQTTIIRNPIMTITGSDPIL
ncbi:hypothetical protein TeGR_g14782, partial [Tetraparma gracilis]